MSDFPKQLRDFGSYNVMCEAADHIEHLEARLAEANLNAEGTKRDWLRRRK